MNADTLESGEVRKRNERESILIRGGIKTGMK
jgi:hypothetical protein